MKTPRIEVADVFTNVFDRNFVSKKGHYGYVKSALHDIKNGSSITEVKNNLVSSQSFVDWIHLKKMQLKKQLRFQNIQIGLFLLQMSKLTPADYFLISTALCLTSGVASWLMTRNRLRTTENVMRAGLLGVGGFVADSFNLITTDHSAEYEYSLAQVNQQLTDLTFPTFTKRS